MTNIVTRAMIDTLHDVRARCERENAARVGGYWIAIVDAAQAVRLRRELTERSGMGGSNRRGFMPIGFELPREIADALGDSAVPVGVLFGDLLVAEMQDS